MDIQANKRHAGMLAGSVITAVILLFHASQLYKTVPAGHVSVATLFGDVQTEPFKWSRK